MRKHLKTDRKARPKMVKINYADNVASSSFKVKLDRTFDCEPSPSQIK